MLLTDELLQDLYRRMVRIRLFEEAAGRLFESSKMPGFIHLYVGQEAVAAGVCVALALETRSAQPIVDMGIWLPEEET